MREELSRVFSRKKVYLALQQMHPTKASGLNVMPPLFYQKYWHVMGNLVTDVVLRVLNTGTFPRDFNHTFITLIPKKEKVMRVVDYRPISLCNVLHKLIAKVIANRLKYFFSQKIIFES